MVKDIIHGHFNELFNIEDELSKERLEICDKCKLLFEDPILGKICNKHLFLNPITDEVSVLPKVGFKNGCNCRMEAKTRLLNAFCPLGKWSSVNE